MIHECGNNLFLIDLDQPREGFRHFISSWILRGTGGAVLVDTGPRSTIPVLQQALRELGITTIPYILLTHIHIDHAGGTGLLINDYPEAKVICHPKGIGHMVQPEKLWESSRQVLGHLAELYGEIEPIPPERIAFQETVELESGPVRVLQTPGHAPHHLSFLAEDCLFAGEVAGVTCPLERGFYLRPTTPPVFDLETQMRSLEKVASLDISTVCLGHYGIRHDPQSLFSHAKAQIPRWLGIMETHVREKSETFQEIVFKELLAQDPCMQGYHLLPEDIRTREREFISNSIRGMKGYLLKNLL